MLRLRKVKVKTTIAREGVLLLRSERENPRLTRQENLRVTKLNVA